MEGYHFGEDIFKRCDRNQMIYFHAPQISNTWPYTHETWEEELRKRRVNYYDNVLYRIQNIDDFKEYE